MNPFPSSPPLCSGLEAQQKRGEGGLPPPLPPGRITLLALNAGTGGPHGFGDGDSAAFEKILAVNVLGVVHGITTLLPLVREAGGPAAIVVTGSKQGITNPPGNPAYNASKAAVKSLAEQLSYDLRATPVAVHLLVPGCK